jgi:hypothetical protein
MEHKLGVFLAAKSRKRPSAASRNQRNGTDGHAVDKRKVAKAQRGQPQPKR